MTDLNLHREIQAAFGKMAIPAATFLHDRRVLHYKGHSVIEKADLKGRDESIQKILMLAFEEAEIRGDLSISEMISCLDADRNERYSERHNPDVIAEARQYLSSNIDNGSMIVRPPYSALVDLFDELYSIALPETEREVPALAMEMIRGGQVIEQTLKLRGATVTVPHPYVDDQRRAVDPVVTYGFADYVSWLKRFGALKTECLSSAEEISYEL